MTLEDELEAARAMAARDAEAARQKSDIDAVSAERAKALLPEVVEAANRLADVRRRVGCQPRPLGRPRFTSDAEALKLPRGFALRGHRDITEIWFDANGHLTNPSIDDIRRTIDRGSYSSGTFDASWTVEPDGYVEGIIKVLATEIVRLETVGPREDELTVYPEPAEPGRKKRSIFRR